VDVSRSVASQLGHGFTRASIWEIAKRDPRNR
jgi:hypothetical protein